MLLSAAAPARPSYFRTSRASWLGFSLTCVLLGACGSRTIVRPGVDETTVPCASVLDCENSNLCEPQACVAGFCETQPVECPEPRECETVACNPDSGLCESTPVTQDLDGDGFNAPLPGFVPGAEGSCGDDCDDTNRLAWPGGQETCDGADNDCDGVIDNNSLYLDDAAAVAPVIALEPDSDGSGRRGIAYGQGVFVGGYWARNEEMLSYLQGISDDVSQAQSLFRVPATNVNAPSFGADVAWSGESFAAVWSDPRIDDNYEVFFARFGSDGEKLGPDVRLSNAPDFSIHARVLFDQGRWVVAWDDRRDEETGGQTQVFAQLLDASGNLSGGNLRLTDPSELAEYPSLAATAQRFGLVYTRVEQDSVGLVVRTFDKEFKAASSPTVLTTQDSRSPHIEAVGDLFIVTWDVYDIGPGPSIYGAVLNGQGQVLIAPQALTAGAAHARSHTTVSLGDRFLLVWSDDFADDNYELYAKVLSLDFNEVEARKRLTFEATDTLSPEAALGETGRVGIIFDDWRSGTHGAYFTSVGCAADAVTVLPPR